MMNSLELMRKRLEFNGGIRQEDRMIKGKYETFLRTLQFSYQGVNAQLIQPHTQCFDLDDSPIVRALITPDKTKQDYDDKILSIDYRHNFNPGDVFKWVGTDSYWLIYLQTLTEDAYFRGTIRRCRYKIKFKDENGNIVTTWAAIRGPVETQIESIQKNQVRVDRPNLSLNILMPLNEKTLKAFKRYSQFLFAGKCWQVQAPDSISMKNVLEVNAEEYYIDRDTDNIDDEVKNGLVIEPVDPTPQTLIKGNTFIKPKIAERYEAPAANGRWKVLDNLPVCLTSVDDTTVEVVWNKMTSGQFILQWSNGLQLETKTIVVESLY